MKSSLFKKLMHLTIITMLTSAIILSGINYILLKNYVKTEKIEQLKNNSRQISSTMSNLIKDFHPLTNALVELNLDIVSSATENYIIITDNNGNITSASSKVYNNTRQKALDLTVFSEVLEGKEKVINGYFDKLIGENSMAYAAPVKFENAVAGIVCVISPAPSLLNEYRDLSAFFVASMLAATLIAFMLSYFLHMRMTRPIRKICFAAKEMEKGKFDAKIEGCGIEEIDELCSSFNSMAESLGKLEIMRNNFISNVSHDLRTPMTTISGFVNGILDGTIDAEHQDKYLHIVLEEVNRLSKLVNEFLVLTKFQGDKTALHITSFNIAEMLRVRIIALENQINEKNLEVEFNTDEENIFVDGDYDAIERVVSNLLDNAIKYAIEGTKIKTYTEIHNNKIHISIENQGDVIANSELPLLFERFYKVDKSRSTNKNSLGLGLYIVKSIIDEHDEEIFVTSENGVTTFTFTLKLSKKV